MYAVTDLLVGQVCKESLDLIDPGRRGRREVDVPSSVFAGHRRIAGVLGACLGNGFFLDAGVQS
jgi:hypothetical protein